MTELTAREVLEHECRGLTYHAGNAGAVPFAVVIRAMEAFASRSVEEARREERERAAEIATSTVTYVVGDQRRLCDQIAADILLPDAPERDGGRA